MHKMIIDRLFWLYAIVVIFFSIIGLGFLLSSAPIWVPILWFFSSLILLVFVYNLSPCLSILGYILFFIILVFMVLWAAEFNTDNSIICGVAPAYIILASLLLFKTQSESEDIVPCAVFCLIWMVLGIYAVIS